MTSPAQEVLSQQLSTLTGILIHVVGGGGGSLSTFSYFKTSYYPKSDDRCATSAEETSRTENKRSICIKEH